MDLGNGDVTAAWAEKLKSQRSKAEQTVPPPRKSADKKCPRIEKRLWHIQLLKRSRNPPLFVMSCCDDLKKHTRGMAYPSLVELNKQYDSVLLDCVSAWRATHYCSRSWYCTDTGMLAPPVSSTLPAGCFTELLPDFKLTRNLTGFHSPNKK